MHMAAGKRTQILGGISACGSAATTDAGTGGGKMAAGGVTGAKRVIVDVVDAELGAGKCLGGMPGGKPPRC